MDRSDKRLESRLDKRLYDDKDLREFAIPLNLPYFNNQAGYERANGEVSYDGIVYSYVKRRVSNDTLYIMCLPNMAKTKLQTAQSEYAKKANGPSEKQNHTGKKVIVLSDHNQQLAEYSLGVIEPVASRPLSLFVSPLHASFIPTNYQPPEMKA